MPPAPPSAPQDCPNCGSSLQWPGLAGTPKFCPACGQETHVQPPTLAELAQQFGGAYLSTEGALWRTLKLLLTRPGELTRLYLAGRRKHYVLPLRLYLTISVLVLLGVRVLGSDDIEIKAEAAEIIAAENKRSSLDIRLGSGSAGLREGVFFCENLPQWLCQRIQRRVDVSPDAMAGEVNAAKERFLGNLGAAMFLLLPSFALWLKLVYLNRRMRYTEHLVFALHVHAFWFLALALVLSKFGPLAFVGALAVPTHALMAMKRVYGDRWWALLLRALALTLLYGLSLALAMAGVGLWAALG
jgi:Protein of unknown function (DUF3667)